MNPDGFEKNTKEFIYIKINVGKGYISKYDSKRFDLSSGQRRIKERKQNLFNIMKVGLLLGSFNPIHSGHVHLAEKVLNETNVDEVWFVISPQSPFKINHNSVDENLRKKMVNLMIEDNPKLKTCDIEFNLPRPSYTYNTLQALYEKYPGHKFEFIVGSDALNTIETWKNYEDIIKMPIIVFIRNNELVNENIKKSISNLTIIHSTSDTSSTFIRNYISWGKVDDLEKLQLLNKKTIKFIKDNKLYNHE